MSAVVARSAGNAPRPFTIERRDISTPDRARFRPKPDAEAELRDVAGTMTHLPRDCFNDPAELVTLMRRLAGRLVKVADTGMEAAPSHAARATRQPFMARPRADVRAVADGVFGAGGRARDGQVGTVTSRKGRTVRIEVRRARAAENIQLLLFPAP